MKRLAIVGSNDLAQLIAHHAVTGGQYTIAGFFDNKKPAGTPVAGFGSVAGTAEQVEPLFQAGFFDELLIGVGYTQFDFRKAAFDRFSARVPMATLIHRSAYVDPSCAIGRGVVVLPGCVLDMGVALEDNVLLNTAVSISHHSTVKAHSFVAPRVSIAGYVTVGSLCFIGIGATIIDNVDLCERATIGGGSLVLKDVTEPGVYYGHPIKPKRNHNNENAQ